MAETVRVKVEGKWYTVEVGDLTRRPVTAVVDGHTIEVDMEDSLSQPDSSSQRRVARPSPPDCAAPVSGFATCRRRGRERA